MVLHCGGREEMSDRRHLLADRNCKLELSQSLIKMKQVFNIILHELSYLGTSGNRLCCSLLDGQGNYTTWDLKNNLTGWFFAF